MVRTSGREQPHRVAGWERRPNTFVARVGGVRARDERVADLHGGRDPAAASRERDRRGGVARAAAKTSTAVTDPEVVIVAVAVALVFVPSVSVIVTAGFAVYPLPGLVMVMPVTAPPAPTVAVAVAVVPPRGAAAIVTVDVRQRERAVRPVREGSEVVRDLRLVHRRSRCRQANRCGRVLQRGLLAGLGHDRLAMDTARGRYALAYS